MAYQTQKDINRVLERDLEQERTQSRKRETELRDEINELKADNERQQNLIGQVLQIQSLPPSSPLYNLLPPFWNRCGVWKYSLLW